MPGASRESKSAPPLRGDNRQPLVAGATSSSAECELMSQSRPLSLMGDDRRLNIE